ncbi:hypothetical protein F2P81_019840 [Scophthalmus maximus]|uniref:Reverse transcriptase/retrotransposon-derived protein RNase H-like domain-containing protein n=1 Tax=Scophthalmus maximus TaxID=52904 RepID=A0A6A4S3K4_SCOMX|nr:hypothetical protein F2P81_019840 [Scophthalmus maximus]
MLAHPSSMSFIAINSDASDYAVGAVYEQWVAELWSARQQRHLSYISEFTKDLQHVAGKNNHVADCLSRALAGAVHLGLDYNHIAADQTTDPDVQLLRTSTTGPQIEDVFFGDAGTTLLCDVSAGSPRPIIPTGWRRQVFDGIHGLSHPRFKSYEGSFHILESGDKHFVVDMGGKPEQLSIDRLKPAQMDVARPIVLAQPPRRRRPPSLVSWRDTCHSWVSSTSYTQSSFSVMVYENTMFIMFSNKSNTCQCKSSSGTRTPNIKDSHS